MRAAGTQAKGIMKAASGRASALIGGATVQGRALRGTAATNLQSIQTAYAPVLTPQPLTTRFSQPGFAGNTR